MSPSSLGETTRRVRCANDPELFCHGEVEFEDGSEDFEDEEWGVTDASGTELVEHAFTFRRSRGSDSEGMLLVREPEEEVCGACGG